MRSLGAFGAQLGHCQKSAYVGPRRPGQTCVCSSNHGVYELSSLKRKDMDGGSVRGRTYLDFRMVWGNAISNEPVWCP